jgi:hypothetical protein
MKQNRNVVNRTVRTGPTKSKSVVDPDNGLYKRSNKTALFLAGVSALYGEGKFYASGNDEAARFKELVAKVTKSDPDWTFKFLVWLRNEANIRTASIVGAAEYVRAGGPNGRSLVDKVLVRADEPGEILAYWFANYGKRVPQPIKRGVADAAKRLYWQGSYAKWDSSKASVRFSDVIELTHPKPNGPQQSDLFRYAIEDRHGRGTFEGKSLPMLEARAACTDRDDYLFELASGNRTVTWENVSSAGKGKMTAAQWVQCYGHMGYMAQLRNLRNLDEAGVPLKIKRTIGSSLADPDRVATSKQLPIRFYSAYRNVNDDVWASYLSEALEHSLNNVPRVEGKWLVVVDASGSMSAQLSKDSFISYYDAATVFAAAFAKTNDADVYTYSRGVSPKFDMRGGESVLSMVKRLHGREFWMQAWTETASALRELWNPKYTHVLLLTDEQNNGFRGDPSNIIPANVPMYTFNLAGYTAGNRVGENRITVGGLSDAGFSMIAMVESGKTKWPWE